MIRHPLTALLAFALVSGAAAAGSPPEHSNPSPSAILQPWGMSALPMDLPRESKSGNVVTIERRPRTPGPTPPPCPAPPSVCYYVNGGYQWTTQRVWVPDQWQQRYVPPVYEPRWVYGQQVWVMVQPERYENVLVRGHYDNRRVQVWVPGRWVCPGGHPHHRH